MKKGIESSGGGVALKRTSAGNHLKEHDTEGKQVSAGIELFS